MARAQLVPGWSWQLSSGEGTGCGASASGQGLTPPHPTSLFNSGREENSGGLGWQSTCGQVAPTCPFPGSGAKGLLPLSIPLDVTDLCPGEGDIQGPGFGGATDHTPRLSHARPSTPQAHPSGPGSARPPPLRGSPGGSVGQGCRSQACLPTGFTSGSQPRTMSVPW